MEFLNFMHDNGIKLIDQKKLGLFQTQLSIILCDEELVILKLKYEVTPIPTASPWEHHKNEKGFLVT